MSAESKDASLGAPIAAADATGKTGVHRYVSSATNRSIAIPSGMYGNFIRVRSIGTETDVAVSKWTAQTLVKDQPADLGTGAAAAGDTVLANTQMDFIVPRRNGAETHYLNFISGDANGFVIIYMAEELVV